MWKSKIVVQAIWWQLFYVHNILQPGISEIQDSFIDPTVCSQTLYCALLLSQRHCWLAEWLLTSEPWQAVWASPHQGALVPVLIIQTRPAIAGLVWNTQLTLAHVSCQLYNTIAADPALSNNSQCCCDVSMLSILAKLITLWKLLIRRRLPLLWIGYLPTPSRAGYGSMNDEAIF